MTLRRKVNFTPIQSNSIDALVITQNMESTRMPLRNSSGNDEDLEARGETRRERLERIEKHSRSFCAKDFCKWLREGCQQSIADLSVRRWKGSKLVDWWYWCNQLEGGKKQQPSFSNEKSNRWMYWLFRLIIESASNLISISLSLKGFHGSRYNY